MRGRVLAVTALVTYNSWLAWRLNGDPEVLTGYLSELAAQDQPYQWFFRLGDTLAASTFAVIAALGRRGWVPWLGRRAPQAALALLLVALGTFLDVVFNLPCAESRDALCAATPSITRRLHEGASVLAAVGLVALIGLSALGLAERHGRWERSARLTAGLTALVGVLLLVSAVAPLVAPGTQGAIQAVQVVVCSGWIAVMAWHLPGAQHA